MSWRLVVSRVLPISSLLLVVLFKFENCAPTGAEFSSVAGPGGIVNNLSPGSTGSNSGGAGPTGPGPGIVGIVENYNSSPLSFVANPQLVAQPDQDGPMAVQGLCVGGPTQQTIEYQVIDMRDTPKVVMAGQVPCELGGFALPVAHLDLHKCSDRFEVRAARTSDPSQFATTTLQLDCQSQEATESKN